MKHIENWVNILAFRPLRNAFISYVYTPSFRRYKNLHARYVTLRTLEGQWIQLIKQVPQCSTILASSFKWDWSDELGTPTTRLGIATVFFHNKLLSFVTQTNIFWEDSAKNAAKTLYIHPTAEAWSFFFGIVLKYVRFMTIYPAISRAYDFNLLFAKTGSTSD